MTFKIDGLDELEETLGKLAENAKDLDREHEVPMSEMFTGAFMKTHTSFEDFDSFVMASGLIKGDLTPEAFAAIPDAPWDAWVQKETSFENWEDMMAQATSDWAERRLMDGVG